MCQAQQLSLWQIRSSCGQIAISTGHPRTGHVRIADNPSMTTHPTNASTYKGFFGTLLGILP
jgi:hypothetical protein